MRTVFITGAGGFVGSRLFQHLRQRGYEAVAGVRNRARKLAYERQHGKALVCDVADPINVARVIASVRPDAVVHLAGISNPSEVGPDPLLAYQTIVSSWANLLDAVRRAVPRAKIVLASACDVYGESADAGSALREDADVRPITTFGSLKRAAETIAATFFRDYHLNVTIARPFHCTGPGQSERSYFGAIARRLANWDSAVDGDEFRVPDLSCRRDVLHVDDVVGAYERLLADGRPNETYNICSGEAPACRELLEIMVAELGQPIRLTELPAKGDGPHIPLLLGDNRKLHDELGWQPTRTARDAVRELFAGCRTPTPAQAA